MIDQAFRLLRSLTEATGEMVVDATSIVIPGDYISIPPRTLRRLLLHFEDSIQGRIPEILGDDREERVQTLVRLLDGTTTRDMDELLEAMQEALARLAEDDGRRRGRRLRRERLSHE